ncbi:LysE family translocator [Streptomyces sp. NPDC006984]|uniref:LysE family translocator n=1 Tax=Streptomyces sp. NPDC006984 TaxID=3155463 RepID=UPI0033FB8836
MPSSDRVLAFTAVSFVLIAIPGPSVLFVVGRALALGRRAALTTVAGNTLGVCVPVLAVALGVGSVVERSATLYTILRLAGAAYLVHLGIRAWRERGRIRAAVPGAQPPARGRRTFWEGFAVGATNPKTIVFFAAVLPQFVDRGQGHAAAQMLLLGLVFTVIAALCDGAWGLAAGTARSWFARSPRRLELLGGTGGLAMIGLGVGMAATGRAD